MSNLLFKKVLFILLVVFLSCSYLNAAPGRDSSQGVSDANLPPGTKGQVVGYGADGTPEAVDLGAVVIPMPTHSDTGECINGRFAVSGTTSRLCTDADSNTWLEITGASAGTIWSNPTVVTRTLTVSDPLNGNSITGTGINCPGDCTEDYADGTVVALTAVPTTGYQFDNWTGDLTGSTNPDSVTMSAARSVGATFSVSGGATAYYGYPITGGTPDPSIGARISYGTAGTAKAYVREATTTASGTITRINIYSGTGSWNGIDYAYGCVYNDSTLVGLTSNLTTPPTESWTGWQTVTAVNGESLAYSNSDTLRFGLCGQPMIVGSLARDEGDTTSSIYYDSATAWSNNLPPATATFTNHSSAKGLMIAIEVTE